MSTMVEILQRIVETRGEGCESGLCRELAQAEDRILYPIMELWAGWEHYSGDLLYPVPDPQKPDDPAAAEAAFAAFPLGGGFIGEYGELRLKLAAYLLEALRAV